MGDLATNPEYQRLIIQSLLAQQRSLSRYGNRESIYGIPQGEGHWYLLRCRGGKEAMADEALEAKGFQTYRPMIWVKHRARRGHIREAEQAMFGTYLFIRCLPIHWERARNVAGVQAFIGCGLPECIPEGIMDQIHRVEAEFATKAGRQSIRWKMDLGDKVMATDGPFAYFYGEITSAVDSHGRIKALMSIFGRSVSVEFDADQLEKA